VRGQFRSPISLAGPTGQVSVSGPLTDIDPTATRATVVCVLVDDGKPPAWAEGQGTWEQGDADWRGSVARVGRILGGSDTRPLQAGEARGVAIAIVVREDQSPGGKLVPPVVDTLTWCVDVELV
jgi:hypothetical protein